MDENEREVSGGRNWWWKEFQRPLFARIFRKIWVNLHCSVKNKAKKGFGEAKLQDKKRVPQRIRSHTKHAERLRYVGQ